MGLAKNRMMEIEERGYGEIDKLVCKDCIGDKYLKSIIVENDVIDECAYCNNTANVISLEDLMEFIMIGISCKYSRAVDELGYNSREGGYLGKTWDSYDVVYDDLANELDVSEDGILDDINNILNDEVWCERNPYSLSDDKDDIYTWQSFSELLKHKIRYVFFYQETKDRMYERYRRPSDILMRIGDGIDELALAIDLDIGNKIFRGRMHNTMDIEFDSKSLGSPPANCAGYNRMNPEGISMFYGAFNHTTAFEEINDVSYTHYTVGQFCLNRAIRVIDFSLLDKIEYPSIFDIDAYDSRLLINFFRTFVDMITKPISEGEKLDYIPTQVVTEYFRHVYKYNGQHIDGIIYKSSKNIGEKCIVIFADNNECSDDGTKLLRLDKSTLRTIKV